jgi:alpha-D-xyloside xylohydrolase
VAYVRLRARTSADPNEGFYGLGEQEDFVDNRGKLRPMQLEPDGSTESGYNEAHAPIPLLVGSHGWGIFVEDKRVGLFDVARKEPSLVEITYGTGATTNDGFVFHLYSEDKPVDIPQHYYRDTAFPKLPAPWALGPFLWRNDTTGEKQIRDDIAKVRSLHIPASAMWIDRPYSSKIGSFDFDPASYTDPAGMIKAAQAAGLRMGLWHVPYVEAGADPFRSTVEKQGYFPVQSGILFQKWSPPIDFTAPGAAAFWKDALSTYVNAGIEGFKLDYAEDVIPALRNTRNTWKFHDGTDERTGHYAYTRAYHDAYKSALPESSFLLCRAARWGDQASASIIWPGDMDATFTHHGEPYTTRDGKTVKGVGGLPATVVQGLSLSVSGFPFFASDTGGYRESPPDNELYIRWFEQTSLAAVMEVGDGSSQMPWEFTADNGRTQATLDLFKQYASLHMRLFPYAWTLAQDIIKTGHPVIRPLGFAYPELGVHPSDEYMFGDDLLVAPVMERGATHRSVVFPAGEWIDWWDGTVYPGGTTKTVPAPLEKLPLFLRATAAVPMLRPTVETLSPVTDPTTINSFAADPGVLTVRLAPRAAAPTALNAYDGFHLDAAVALPTITVNLNGGTLFTKGVLLELVGTPAPASVSVGTTALAKAASLDALGKADSGYFVTADMGGTVWVKLPLAQGEGKVLTLSMNTL